VEVSKEKTEEERPQITIEPHEFLDEKVKHHTRGGIDRKKVDAALIDIGLGRIIFIGAYHENRKKKAIAHLQGHLDEVR
jgi:hypothetical protein